MDSQANSALSAVLAAADEIGAGLGSSHTVRALLQMNEDEVLVIFSAQAVGQEMVKIYGKTLRGVPMTNIRHYSTLNILMAASPISHAPNVPGCPARPEIIIR